MKKHDKKMSALCPGTRGVGGAGQEGPRKEARGAGRVRLATDDFTPEVLCDLLQVSNKVLLRSDELATVLGAYERYQKAGAINAGRAHMLALYDGGPRRIDRVLRGKMFVENWSAVPVGHIQPAKVRQLVSGLSDDGLLQRFMIVMPPRVEQGDPTTTISPTDWSAIDRFAQIVEILFAMRPPETQGPGGKPEYCKVEAEHGAHAIRRRLFRLVERIEADPILPAPLKEATSKWRGLLARLSLLFHCIELAEAKHAGQRPDPIDHAHAQADDRREGLPLHHADRGAEHLPLPHRDRQRRRQRDPRPLGRGLYAEPRLESITARDIGRAYREIRGNRAEIVPTMDLLDHAGWVAAAPREGRGTPPGWSTQAYTSVRYPGRGRKGASRGCEGTAENKHRGAGSMRRRPSKMSPGAGDVCDSESRRGSRAGAGFAGRRPKRHLRARERDQTKCLFSIPLLAPRLAVSFSLARVSDVLDECASSSTRATAAAHQRCKGCGHELCRAHAPAPRTAEDCR